MGLTKRGRDWVCLRAAVLSFNTPVLWGSHRPFNSVKGRLNEFASGAWHPVLLPFPPASFPLPSCGLSSRRDLNEDQEVKHLTAKLMLLWE